MTLPQINQTSLISSFFIFILIAYILSNFSLILMDTLMIVVCKPQNLRKKMVHGEPENRRKIITFVIYRLRQVNTRNVYHL